MKVSDVMAANAAQPVQNPSPDAAALGTRPEAAATARKLADKVDFSSTTRKAEEVDYPKQASPERLAYLKSMIQSGNYHVPAMEVASKMVSFYSARA